MPRPFLFKQYMELAQNTGNTVALFLTSSVTISDPVYFLFKLYNGPTNENLYFQATDISPNPYIYNQFLFTLTGSTANQNLTAGTISVRTGTYYLDVFQASAITSSFSGAIGASIYQTVVHISGSSFSQNIPSYTGSSPTIYSYSPAN